jgi:metal-responsive CopG/Arc/MetJ family transcriptional regulator
VEKYKRIVVVLPERLWAKVDRDALVRRKKRSEIIRGIVRRFYGEDLVWEEALLNTEVETPVDREWFEHLTEAEKDNG